MEISAEMLKELQKAELDLLTQFTDWCDAHQIRYWMTYGTALGAIRHGGWIPWDDDIDIDMPIEDMKKLSKIWKKSGIPGLFLQTQKTDPNLPGLFYCIRQDGTTSMGADAKRVPMHWGLSLDIFPVYHAPKTEKWQKIQKKCYKKADVISNFRFNNYPASVSGGISINKAKVKTIQLANLNTARILSFLSKKSKKYSRVKAWHLSVFDEKVLYPLRKYPFEDREFYFVNDYDTFLTVMYGDYMKLPPEENRKIHPYGMLDLHKDFREYVDYEWKPRK